MNEKSLIPAIRFAGFADAWERRKLGDIAVFNPKEDLPNEFEYVDLESVVGIEMLSHRLETKQSAPSRAQRLARKGDLFYQMVRPYQKNNFLFEKDEENYVFSTGYAQIRPSVNGYFVLSLVQGEKFTNTVLDNCTGTSYPAINANDLASIEVYVPTGSKEACVVGHIFRTIDRLITLHQRKHEKLLHIKKSMLDKMFPKDGELFPEVRFAGFTAAWERRKLFDNIQKITDFRGRTPKKLGMEWSSDGYLALSALNVKNGYIDYSEDAHYGSQELYDKWMSGNELHQGQVLFTTEAPMGNVAQVPDGKRYILSQRTIAFEVKDNMITENFLAVLLRTPHVFSSLTSMSSGGTAKGISQKLLATVEVIMPGVIDEQNAIATLFLNLDHLITLHQRKLEKLQNIKKACLEKMFV